MRHRLALLALLLAPVGMAHAQSFNMQGLQNMLNNPQTQQLLQQQLGGAAAVSASATPALSTTQQSTLMTQLQSVMQQNLTGAEQTKLQQFSGTPEGQSIMQKLPGMMQQLAPVLLQMYMGQGVAPAAAPMPTPVR